jgi:hypothetical protein
MMAPATDISHFLDQLLRPILNRAATQTTFINDTHFVRRMELYRDIEHAHIQLLKHIVAMLIYLSI